MNTDINEICKEFNVIYMEIINVVDLRKRVCGKIEELPYKGLYLNLLGDETKIRNLIRMFETGTRRGICTRNLSAWAMTTSWS